jgi:hypothetical protein
MRHAKKAGLSCPLVLLGVLASVIWGVPASAQMLPYDGGVSGSAKITLRPKPTKLRLQMELWSYGNSVDAALRNLKSRRDAATGKLKVLKAEEASISWSIPRTGAPAAAAVTATVPSTVTTYQVSPDGSYRAYNAPSLSGDLRPVAPNEKPIPRRLPQFFVMSATLRADWTLDASDPDRIAAMAEAIRAKVAAANLGGSPQKLSPEEQEIAEDAEMARSRQSPPGVSITPPPDGEHAGPVFVFVATISDAERKAALASGYTRARKRAAELARAAGKELGEITSLYSNFNNSCSPGRDLGPEYDSSVLASPNDTESVSTIPDGIRFDCEVMASFRLVPAASNR